MDEPIKLPEMSFDFYSGLADVNQYNDVRAYARLAVEQNTAALRAERDALLALLTTAGLARAQEEHNKVRAECDALVQATGASSVLEAIGIILGNKAELDRLTTLGVTLDVTAAAEREACAKVCEALNFVDNGTPAGTRASNRHCAAAIRARGAK